LGQAKVTSIYDKEKYGGNIDVFYKNDRNKFFESFGVDQLVNSIHKLEDTIGQVDNEFPLNKAYKIFPVIIVNEKALQTPLMAKIFQDRFVELISDKINLKVTIAPITIMHISDLENIQQFIFEKPNEIWELLEFHCRFPQFMPPLFNSINRKDIRPSYKSTMGLYEELINKFQNNH